jgi:hypothetical protein
LLAQEPGAPYEVSGIVYDTRTNLPIEGATLIVTGPNSTSDSRGAFRVRVDGMSPGIGLSVTKPGYVRGLVRDLRRGMNDLKIGLKPSPEITGQLVDSETGVPLAGISVALSPPGSMSNANLLLMMRSVGEKTAKDGRFALPFDPSSGSLLFTAFRPPAELLHPSPDDPDMVDQDYEPLVWPGDGSPLNVASGISVDAGILRLRKVSYYRANLSLSAAGCPAATRPAASFNEVALFVINGGVYSRPVPGGALRCGEKLAVGGLQPGSYRIEVTNRVAAVPDRRWALMDFAIANKNVDLDVILAPGVDLPGRVVLAEGARLPQRFTVSLSEIDTSPNLSSQIAGVSPAVNGTFRFPNEALGLKEILVRGLPSSYTTEVRFRGAALPGNVLRWEGTGELELLVDDRGATISGRVTDGRDPVTFALVFAFPWPKPPVFQEGEAQFARYVVRVDPRGQFAQQGLRAGEYRVFAIPADRAVWLFDPVMQQRLLQQAEHVTLDRGATQSITLRLLDPSR